MVEVGDAVFDVAEHGGRFAEVVVQVHAEPVACRVNVAGVEVERGGGIRATVAPEFLHGFAGKRRVAEVFERAANPGAWNRAGAEEKIGRAIAGGILGIGVDLL